MDEAWLKELNKRNLENEGEDCSQRDFAKVTLSLSILEKLSEE